MKVIETYKGRTEKTAFVQEVTTESDREIAEFAAKASGETMVSIFGWRVDWQNEDTVKVTLYTA